MGKKLIVYTDGASRGNPGPSASGYIIYKEGKLIREYTEYNGINTNNYSEYKAILLALEWCYKNQSNANEAEIELFSDSKLVVSQLNSLYKIRAHELRILSSKAKELEKNFKKVSIVNKPRNYKGIKLVDRALNRLLDSSTLSSPQSVL